MPPSVSSLACAALVGLLVAPSLVWLPHGRTTRPLGPPTAPLPSSVRQFAVDGPAQPLTAFDPGSPDHPPPNAPVPGEDVAIRGVDGAVWLRGWDGRDWTGWWSLGGRAASAPAIASWGPGRLDVFATAVDGALWHRWWEGEWQPWEWLGGSLAEGSTLAAMAPAPGRLDLFARGVDHALWHRSLGNGGWGAWERLGCCISSDPAATSVESSQVHVFVERTSGGLWDLTVEAASGASIWRRLGGRRMTATQSAATSSSPGRIDVFIRGGTGDLWHRFTDGGQWRAWEALGCCLRSIPAVASWGSGEFDLFGRGPDDQLWKRRFSGVWGAWEKLGGQLTAAPAATTWAAATNVIANIPYRPQLHTLSCEAAALEMALAHQGIDVSQDQVLDDTGIDWRPAYYDGSGELRWGDPYTTFVGDPDGDESLLSGYGTYFPTIARVAADHGAGVVMAGEGISPDDVYRAVLQNHPVVAWVSVDLQYYSPGSWRTFDGGVVMYAGPIEHAVTVVGVDGDSVYLFDPLSGPGWASKSVFEAAFETFNRMAVILE
jgi:uncharacterized protein YvpB